MIGSRPVASTDSPCIRLRSAIRGRERWEVKVLRNKPGMAQELGRMLLQHADILQVNVNSVTGSVLVIYSAGAHDFQFESLLRSHLTELLSRDASSFKTTGTGTALKRILKTALPHDKSPASPLLLSVASHSLHILQGLSFIGIVNTAKGEGPRFLKFLGLTKPLSRLTFMTALSMLLSGLDLWLQYHRKKAWLKLAHTTRHNLRVELLNKIEAQDLAFFDNYGTGRLINLVIDDTARVGDFVEQAGDEIIEKALTIIVAGAFLISASPLLALLACLPLPFILLSSRFWGPSAAEGYARAGEASQQFSQMLENNLAGIVEVKSFTAEGTEKYRLNRADVAVSEAAFEAASVVSLMNHFSRGIFFIGFSLTAGFGGRLAVSGKISSSQYLAATYWFPQLLGSLTGVEKITKLYYGANGSAKRLAEVLDSSPQILSGGVRLPVRQVRGEVVFENVSFGYTPSVKLLENVSFHLLPGEMLGIVGPTGSGKSTLLRLLLRFYEVDSGRILLDGIDIRDLNLQDLRAALSLVSQDVYLFQESVRENVRFGQPQATEKQVVKAMRDAASLDVLKSLPQGLETEVGERGSRLSGGERQRVAIARALLKGAPILALDEATSHLDNETESAVRKSLRKAAAKKSVIMIAHRLATIRRADKIIVLERGKIREQGSHEELLTHEGLYATLWRLQNGEEPSGGGFEVRLT
ncbi:MAG: ATP-binding cassette domain-containing protein [Pyrinomonadaceae bacterium]